MYPDIHVGEKVRQKAAAIYYHRQRKKAQVKETQPLESWLENDSVTPPTWGWDMPHAQRFKELANLLSTGVVDKLALSAPVRHAKTEFWGIRYPVFRMERRISEYYNSPETVDPHFRHIYATYNQKQANRISHKARRIASRRFTPSVDKWNLEEWETMEGASYRAAGIRSGIAGVGAHLLTVDDPFKNREEANSAVIRDAVWESFKDDFMTRLEPDGQVFVSQARWHEDDVIGRILNSDEKDEWVYINIPAIAESQQERDTWAAKFGLPTGEPDPVGRKEGEALWPERYSVEKLLRLMATIPGWYGLYQGRPRPREGTLFRRDYFKTYSPHEAASRLIRVGYLDKAGTVEAGKRSCMLMLAGDPFTGRVMVEDVVKGQWEGPEREYQFKQWASAYALRLGGGNPIAGAAKFELWIEQEPADSGKESALATIRNMAGFKVFKDVPRGDKYFRAEPVATYGAAGLLYVADKPWAASFISECLDFPFGTYSDQVDALSGAFSKLVNKLTGGPGNTSF